MNTCTKCNHRPAEVRGLCDPCYTMWRKRQRAYGRWDDHTLYTDMAATREHVIALRSAGLGLRRIAELSAVRRLTLHNIVRREHGRVLKRIEQQILAIPVPVKPHDAGVADSTFINPIGSIRRVQALVVAGHSLRSLSKRMGYADARFVTGLTRGERIYVTAEFARRVDALFSELEYVPGESARARNHAERKGWSPAIAWDEDTIDEPNAKPQHNAHRFVGFVERYRELRDHVGIKDVDLIAEEMDIEPHSVRDQIRRYRKVLAS